MHVENKHNCTGCGACYNICPKDAITMQGDEYGFYKPTIDKEKCVSCGFCERVCPIDNYCSRNDAPFVYSVINNDDKQRFKSASGGVFPLFAKYILNNNGTVYGVIWNKNIEACHSRAEKIDELEKMYSSKYVQSNTKDTYKEALNDLKLGKIVLYSGTPCQIAGLKSFLRKDYDNLLTIEILCHGTASPKIFENSIKDFLKDKGRLISLNHRSKVNGWEEAYTTTATTTTGVYQILQKNDWYILSFLHNLSINNSCIACQFNKLPRVADVTIGDFWGVNEYDKSLNDGKGTSILLINNKKGMEFFEKIQNNCFSRKIPLEVATRKNPNILTSSKPHPKRENFFKDIKKGKSLKKCVKKYIKQPLYMKIYYLLPQFAKDFIKYKILKREKC